MDFVSAGKNKLLLLYVTVSEKVVPRLNKHDDVIEYNFMKIDFPPKWRAGCATGLYYSLVVFTQWDSSSTVFWETVGKIWETVLVPQNTLKTLFVSIV